jgi:hypothetical protein
MNLTNKELEILQDLVQYKLNELGYGPDGIEVHQKPRSLYQYNEKIRRDV